MTKAPSVDDMSQSSAIVLTEKLGSGGERDCYIHPDNKKLCVKVNRPGVIGRRQNLIDWTYYKSLSARNIASPHIPACHAWINTDKGIGLVTDRICRADFSAAPSVLEALHSGEISLNQATTLINTLFEYMISHNVVVVDYHPDHFILSEQPDSSVVVAIVDGLGTRHLGFRFWLRTHIHAYGRKKTRAVWKKALDSLQS